MPDCATSMKTTLAAASVIATGALLASVAGTARAQTALGDGTGLQRDPQQNTIVYQNGRPPVGRDILAEIRFRNAIVTGNAPGGLSFRGDVGYTDPFEFRGQLGSDDNFGFRRDSLYSGLAGSGIRGTEALQYQMALTTGSRPPQNLFGSLRVRRGNDASGGQFSQGGPAGAALDGGRANTAIDPAADGRLDLSISTRSVEPDRSRNSGNELLQDLRSGLAYQANRDLRPVLLGTSPIGDAGDVLEVRTAPVDGIRFDLKRAERRSAFEVDSRVPSDATGPAAVEGPYTDLINRLRQAGGVENPSPQDLVRPGIIQADPVLIELEKLRGRMASFDPSSIDELSAISSDVGPQLPGAGRDETEVISDETARLLRENAGELETLYRPLPNPVANQRDLYGEHMTIASEHLGDGRFFQAEARYTAAMGIRPGDPAAQLGRVHAQLGAGLLVSAGVNLRRLLTRSPEIAAVTLGPETLPSNERLEEVLELLSKKADEPGPEQRDTLITLAYVARHLGDRATVTGALDALSRLEAEASGQQIDPLARLLRKLWIAR